MAQTAYETKKNFPDAVVVMRFIGTIIHIQILYLFIFFKGTSTMACDGRSLLYSISCQISQAYQIFNVIHFSYLFCILL